MFLRATMEAKMIINESYFIAGNPVLLAEKLQSIADHISNVHAFQSNRFYKACPHLPLTGAREKAWLHSESLVFTFFDISFLKLVLVIF